MHRKQVRLHCSLCFHTVTAAGAGSCSPSAAMGCREAGTGALMFYAWQQNSRVCEVAAHPVHRVTPGRPAQQLAVLQDSTKRSPPQSHRQARPGAWDLHTLHKGVQECHSGSRARPNSSDLAIMPTRKRITKYKTLAGCTCSYSQSLLPKTAAAVLHTWFLQWATSKRLLLAAASTHKSCVQRAR